MPANLESILVREVDEQDEESNPKVSSSGKSNGMRDSQRYNSSLISADKSKLSEGWTRLDSAQEMSEDNVKRLKNAYRHPFEYISPLLYGN